MPYELHFVTASPEAPDRAAFERYFSRRDHYRVERGRASYHNDDTGVTFVFQHDGNAVDSAGRRSWATFALDYVRPSFFAEEATRELEPVAATFGPAVVDPSDRGFTAYLTPTFLKSWERGNREACGPYPETVPEKHRPFTLPQARLLAAWQWNYKRRQLQEDEQDGLFVPKVWFVASGDGVGTGIIWPDAMPLRAPQVDYVIFSREALAPGGGSDVAVARWGEIAGSVTGSAFYDSPLVSWRVTDPQILTGLAQRVARMSGARMPAIVAPDKVLDREGFAA